MSSRFCTNYSLFSSLLSFTSSSPHPAPANSASASQPDLNSPTQSGRPMLNFDPESGEPTTPPDPQSSDPQTDIEPPDWKRTGKVVQTVGLGGVGVSVTLIVNAPPTAESHRALYTAYLSVVGLGLFTGMGLSFFSILMKGSPAVGWVQTRLIFFTLFFVSIACFLRLHLALPLADVMFGTGSVVVGVAVMVIYLYLGRKCKLRRRDA